MTTLSPVFVSFVNSLSSEFWSKPSSDVASFRKLSADLADQEIPAEVITLASGTNFNYDMFVVLFGLLGMDDAIAIKKNPDLSQALSSAVKYRASNLQARETSLRIGKEVEELKQML